MALKYNANQLQLLIPTAKRHTQAKFTQDNISIRPSNVDKIVKAIYEDLEDISASLGITQSFLSLTDTPSGYTDVGNMLVGVNNTEDGIEFKNWAISASTLYPSGTNGNLGKEGNAIQKVFIGNSGNIDYQQDLSILSAGVQKAVFKQTTGYLGLGVNNPLEPLHSSNGIVIGNAVQSTPGTIRYFEGDFKGYDGTDWKSFTILPEGYFNTLINDSDDITEGSTNLFLTTSEQTKLSNISITQPVDLDILESNVTANNAKVSNANHSGDMSGSTTLTAQPELITNKTSVSATALDSLLISDQSDSSNLKKITIQSILDLTPTPDWGNIGGTLSNQTDLQNALNAKENSITAGTTGQYWRGDKTFQTLDKTAVGLSNVDNTSDANKPISSATQTALNAKLSNVVEDTTPQLGGDLDLNNNDINGTGNIDITGNVISDIVQLRGGVGTQGEMSWSTDEETIKLIMDGTTLYMGQDTFVHVRNNTASIITKGTAVYATGTLGASGRITVAPMIADGTIPGRLFIGLAAEDIAIGADGQVMTFGKIRQINTSAFNNGDVLWLSPTVAGQLTATEPTAPNLKIATAFVIHDATNGTLMVRAEQGNDLHNNQRVQVSGLTNNDVLTWNNANQRWQNAQPTSTNIYTNNGTIGSNRVATLTDTLSFSGGRVSFDTNTNGILLPRLTTVQMNGISSPATNLLVYNTDLNGLYRYNGSAWVALSVGYGIIGVYSDSGNGTPVFFADLQSALETCKASGGYFTVKLYSNLTITSAIEIYASGSGVGRAYAHRQITIDFNGFSLTNSQANATHCFDIQPTTTPGGYQEIRMINGNVFRLNNTGSSLAVKIDNSGFGTIQMSRMFIHSQNYASVSIDVNTNTTATGVNRINDLGCSTISCQSGYGLISNSQTTNHSIENFHVIVGGADAGVFSNSADLKNFTTRNTSTGQGLVFGFNAGVVNTATNFKSFSNSGVSVQVNQSARVEHFDAISVSGIAINSTSSTIINDFTAITGNNTALNYVPQNNTGGVTNGRCVNNSANTTVILYNYNKADNIEALNNGSGYAVASGSNQANRPSELTKCKATSIGGIGGYLEALSGGYSTADNCEFVSKLNTSSGHALRVVTPGTILLTNSNMRVTNSGANAINATSATTIRARFCTHNEVATTPFNSNVTVIQSKSIPDEGIPNVTTAQMNAIVSPATNLLVYNTDLNGLYRYNGSAWVALSSGYGIIGVYSGSGNGTPTFFATLQDALETCKASGGYFTVKLYSNITITSSILIDYTGSGVGGAYLFRQLTIDLNGFSITNNQADTSDAFDVRLSNNVAVYQELRFINGVVLRTNGTGTHHALNATASARIGTIQMQNMLFYCQNSISIFINLGISTAVDAKIENDFGNSTFISLNNHAVRVNNITTTIKNFKAISSGNLFSALFISQGKATNFNAEGLLNANGIAISNNTTILDFYCSSNTFTALLIEGANIIANNFRALSNSGRGIDATNSSALISNFTVETGNNFAINSTGNSEFSNGKCRNNSLSQTAFIQNFNSVHELECTNLGGGVGLDVRNNLNGRGEVTMCKSVSIGGVGGIVITSGTSQINCSKCDFISRWNNAGGHGVWAIAGGSSKVQITFANLSVLNSSANAIFSDVTTTIHSRYCTHNNVASTPINANITIVSSGIIS